MKKALVAALIGFSFSHAHGYINTFPIGHEEPLTANTGIAAFGSASAPIYNPALLAGITGSTLSASGSSYTLIRLRPDEGRDASGSSLTSNAHTIINVWKFEKGALAASILSPQWTETDLKLGSKAFDIPANTSIDLEAFSILRTTLIGVSWGQMISEKQGLSLGISTFYGLSTNDSFVWTATNDPNLTLAFATKSRSSTQFLMNVLGASWSGKTTRYGLRLEIPSILMGSSVSGNQVTQGYGTSNGTPFQVQQIAAATSSKPGLRQWGVAFGVEHDFSPNFLLRADAGIDEQMRSIDDTVPDQATMSASSGFKYSLSERIAWLGGVRLLFQDLINNVPETEVKDLEAAFSTGVARRSGNFEANFGLLTVRSFKIRDAQAATTPIFSNSGVEFWSVLFSGLYRF